MSVDSNSFKITSLKVFYTGMGSHSLLQGNFLTQGLNPGLLHGRWILDHLSHQGSPLYIEGDPRHIPRDTQRSALSADQHTYPGGHVSGWVSWRGSKTVTTLKRAQTNRESVPGHRKSQCWNSELLQETRKQQLGCRLRCLASNTSSPLMY